MREHLRERDQPALDRIDGSIARVARG